MIPIGQGLYTPGDICPQESLDFQEDKGGEDEISTDGMKTESDETGTCSDSFPCTP